MNPRNLTALSVMLAMGAFAPAVTAQRSAPASSVPRLEFEKTTLPNGLEVILHEDHSTDRKSVV